MKNTKFFILLMSVIIMISTFIMIPAVDAQRINGNSANEVINSMGFDPNQSLSTELKNGLSIEFSSVLLETYTDNNTKNYKDSNGYIWYKSGVLGISSTYGVNGTMITVTNKTDNVRVISWKSSNLSIDSFSGMPAVGGMKYADFGDPSKTPDTVIPPNGKVSVYVYIPHANIVDGIWEINYMPISITKPFNINLTLKITDENDKSGYYTISSPNIIVPKDVIEKNRKD